jgi:Lon protease-like protein
MSTLLPLFPLDVVLLPGTPLPLHIFEPRYREMVSECLSQEKRFGVVRAKDEGVAEIGCTAEILTVTKKYPDGRMDIVTEGRERFEVMQVNQDRSFLQAEVLYLRDEPGKATADELAQAQKLHGEIMTLAGRNRRNCRRWKAPNFLFISRVHFRSIPISSRLCWA